MFESPILWSLASTFLVGAISLVGISLFILQERLIRRLLLHLVGFSTGALLGDVFLHILPELAEQQKDLALKFLFVLGGILLSFVIEKVIHWRHCHCSALPSSSAHIHPVGVMNLVGDGIHNFVDGALIAGSFLTGIPVGIATTIAVMLHEIPQEIGDFAILLFSGFTSKKALFWNFLSGCIAVVGALAALFLSARFLPIAGEFILPIAAGNFLYLAGSDLIPELHKETRIKQAFLQLACILAGIGMMALLKLLG